MGNATQAHLSDQGDRAYARALPSLLDPVWKQMSQVSISHLNTAPMPALESAKNICQQDLFLGSTTEDITSQITFQIPAIRVAPGVQQQDLAGTVGGAAIAGTGDLIFAALKYVSNVVMTNLVSQSIYGTYMAAYTSATVVGAIAALGLDLTTIRFLATYRAKNERNLAAGLLRFVVGMTLISGLLCGALFYLSSTALAHLVYHQDAYALPLREVALLVPLVALQIVLASSLQALKAIKEKVLTDRLIQPGLALVLMGVFYLLGLRLEALTLATVCGFIASTITGQLLLRKASRPLVSGVAPSFEPQTWLRFALPMSLNSLIQTVLNSTDVLFLTAFTTAAQVGLYAAADRTATFVVMPLLAFGTMFSPQFAEYYARQEYEQLNNLCSVVTKWVFSLSLPVFLCCWIFRGAILGIFSREYAAAGGVLVILALGNLIYAGAGPAGNLLVMTGHTRVFLANTVANILLNIGLGLVLVPRYNITGAAVAAALALTIPSILMVCEAYWILKIIPFRWDMLKPVAAGGVASIAGLALLQVIHVGYGYQAIVEVLGLVIPFALAYILVLTVLGFGEEDMMVFDAVRARISKK
jgi:O-antigen/teichoic acid export membrane protein